MPIISPRDLGATEKTTFSSAAPRVTPKPQPETTSAVEPVRQADTIDDPAKVEAVDTKTEQLSPKFAELARREKLYNEKRKALESKEAELKSREAQYQSADEYRASLKGKFTQSPLEALNELGLSYDQITELVLNQPKPEDLQFQQLHNEIKALKAANEKTATDFQNAEKTRYDQAVQQIRNEVKMLVHSNETFETVKETGSEDAVVELIEETFRQKGILMTVEEAAQEVEDYLIEEALKLAKLKKVQSKLNPAPQAESQEALADAKAKQEEPQVKTLTNTVSHAASKPLTPKERRERAILAFQGRL